MPDQAPIIGGVASAFIPNVTAEIALGWTDVRFYWAASETGAEALVSTQTLVDGTKDYSYNKTDAEATDWFEWCLYNGATEGPRSERLPLGVLRVTRGEVRRGVGRRQKICHYSENTTFTDTDTFVITDFIDQDASVYRFANWFARMFEGDEIGERRRIRPATTTPAGYVPSSGTFNIGRAFSGTPSAGEGVELWRPKADEDPSELIDEAMNRARRRLWFEETFLFTTDSSVTEYAMPTVMQEEAIRAVEFARDTYPSEPRWTPVGHYDFHVELGTPYMSLFAHGIGNEQYESGKVIRVRFARVPDRMDSDSDWWPVRDIEWAIAETAVEYLRTIKVPSGGQEDVTDAATAMADALSEAMEYRAIYTPRATGRVKVAR